MLHIPLHFIHSNTSLNLIFNNSYFVAKVEIFIKKRVAKKTQKFAKDLLDYAIVMKDFLLTQIAVEGKFTP